MIYLVLAGIASIAICIIFAIRSFQKECNEYLDGPDGRGRELGAKAEREAKARREAEEWVAKEGWKDKAEQESEERKGKRFDTAELKGYQ